ncbi:hypothetical protein HYH03_006299 [Edaphochlamys debaryana]|uniref:FHA domain-containing protein n=1 Tax=Edaphochlamys debaryana TaxID=47281 RepID=A0A836C1N4_9CHLO|nr:hypothetical protein HYH03_006299 [Edaphochlamys debaryana]|eukprot:KAG2495699.1 hypothetical protein HYH03_006299 [Edaphochlamys debaryana]
MAAASNAGGQLSQNFVVPPRLKLSIVEGPCVGQEFDSDELALITVGRVKRCKLYIKDHTISEKHAEIAWNGQDWLLRDVDTTNGTRVNGAKLEPFSAHVLKGGEHIGFGLTTIASVELEPRTLADISMQLLLQAHIEARCQALEAASTQATADMVRRCHQAMDALAVPPQGAVAGA